MELGLTAEQQELKDELRHYFARLVDEVEGSEGGEPTYTHYIRRMGEDGWLGLGWPVEYGGRARGPIDQMIFVEESHWAGVPLPLLTLNSVGPTLMALGTDEQKQRILLGILLGKVHFAIGYTEPTAGTDLASLRTRAVRDGDEYVIDGQKLYTSAIQYADYIWLAAGPTPDAPEQRGLSVFIVPVGAPGFSWAPLEQYVDVMSYWLRRIASRPVSSQDQGATRCSTDAQSRLSPSLPARRAGVQPQALFDRRQRAQERQVQVVPRGAVVGLPLLPELGVVLPQPLGELVQLQRRAAARLDLGDHVV